MNETDQLRVALCTFEFPSDLYGGADVHVEYLASQLSQHVHLTVHWHGSDWPTAVTHQLWDWLRLANLGLQTISTELSMVAAR
jgi:starch synthase